MKGSMKFLIVLAAMATTTGAAVAQEATQRPADANKDGFVSREEFVDHMGTTWDEHHTRMMQADPKMKKGMMDQRQYDTFSQGMMGPMSGPPANSPNPNPGLIGGTTPSEKQKK